MLRRLDLFTISTLGGLAQLPRPALLLQFGGEAGLFHDLTRGIDPRPLQPTAPPPFVLRRKELLEPLADRRWGLAVLDRLVEEASRVLLQSGYQAQALSLTICSGEEQHHFGATVKPPSAEAKRLQRLAARLLGKLQSQNGISGLLLSLYPLRRWQLGAQQMSFFDPPAASQQTQVEQGLDNLRQRFGGAVIQLASLLGPPRPLPIRVRTDSQEKPHTLEWGRDAHQLANIYEIWREDRYWWKRQRLVRDYFQVETLTGLVFTLFRDGDGDWFLDRGQGYQE
jgi:DNA polymerase-4